MGRWAADGYLEGALRDRVSHEAAMEGHWLGQMRLQSAPSTFTEYRNERLTLYVAEYGFDGGEYGLQDQGYYYYYGTEAECEKALIELGVAVAQQEKGG